MSFTYDYAQASPCSNILIYTRSGYDVALLTQKRTAVVGTGRALSAGGFDEVKDMFNEYGKIQEGDAETYREMHEELGEEIKTIIPYDDYHERVAYVWDFSRRIRDTQFVEKVVTRSLEVTQGEMDAILALGNTSEQNGKVLEHFNLKQTTDGEIREQLKDFRYPHEVEGAVRWFHQMKRSAGIAAHPIQALHIA